MSRPPRPNEFIRAIDRANDPDKVYAIAMRAVDTLRNIKSLARVGQHALDRLNQFTLDILNSKVRP